MAGNHLRDTLPILLKHSFSVLFKLRYTRTGCPPMLGYEDPIQYSVFVCDLSNTELVYMRQDLTSLLNLNADRVLVVDLGPVESSDKRVIPMGAPLHAGRESSIVI